MKNIVTVLSVLAAASTAYSFEITEFQFKGLFGEYVEVTNTSGSTVTAVNLPNYSFDDNSYTASTVDFPSDQGNWAPGQCIIITEVSRTIFNQAWFVEPSKSPTVSPVIYVDNNTVNLGKSDAASIFVGSTELDRITWNNPIEDAGYVQDASLYSTSTDNFAAWVASGNPDTGAITVTGSWKAGVAGKTGPIGSPGQDITTP